MNEKVNQYNKEELQKIMLETGSLKHFALFLNLGQEDAKDLMRRNDVQLPVDYVRALPEQYLIERLVVQGSFAQLAQELGVSQSFLKQHLRKKVAKTKYAESTPRFTKTQFEKEIQRVGSVRMMARFYNTTQAHIRKYAERFGVDLPKLIDLTSSAYNTGKGARAEEMFKAGRSTVTRSLNEIMGSKAPYDFDDLHFGRVNVKSSQPYQYRAKTRAKQRYWKFSTAGCKEADTFCIICLSNREEIEYVSFVTAKSIQSLNKKTIILTEEKMKQIGTSMDSLHEVQLCEDCTSKID